MAPRTSSSHLRARVIATAERMLLGWIVGVGGGLGLLAAIYDPAHVFNHRPYILVGVGLATWGAGALLARRPRPRVVDVVAERDGIRAGAIKVPFGASARIAKGPRGVSVAMSWGNGDGAFFEVERLDDAYALIAMARANVDARVVLRLRSDIFRWVTRFFAFCGMLSGIGYAIGVGILEDFNLKATFGLPALFTLVPASIAYLISQFAGWQTTVSEPSGAVNTASGVIGRHLALHRLAEAKREADDEEVKESERVGRVRIMTRGNDSTEAWLARVDHAGSAPEGYRSDAPAREELSLVLDDPSAPTDLRLAAARVLVRKHGEDVNAICARIEPELVPYLVHVTEEDRERAAKNLDALGPAFRAR